MAAPGYEGYDPSKYMKDYSWIGDIGNQIAQFAYKMPELAKLNRSIKENQAHNQDTYDTFQEWINTIMNNDKLKQQMSTNYGLEDSEQLRETLSKKFRKPKEREEAGQYTKDITYAMSDVMQANTNVEQSLFGMLQGGALPGAETPGIHAQHEKSKHIHEYKNYFKARDEGAVATDEMGQVSRRDMTTDEARKLAMDTNIPQIITSDPNYAQYNKKHQGLEEGQRVGELIKQVPKDSTFQDAMAFLTESGVSPQYIQMHGRAKWKDEQLARSVTEARDKIRRGDSINYDKMQEKWRLEKISREEGKRKVIAGLEKDLNKANTDLLAAKDDKDKPLELQKKNEVAQLTAGIGLAHKELSKIRSATIKEEIPGIPEQAEKESFETELGDVTTVIINAIGTEGAGKKAEQQITEELRSMGYREIQVGPEYDQQGNPVVRAISPTGQEIYTLSSKGVVPLPSEGEGSYTAEGKYVSLTGEESAAPKQPQENPLPNYSPGFSTYSGVSGGRFQKYHRPKP